MNKFRKGVYRKRIEAAIPGSKGNVRKIAERVGVCHMTIYEFLRRDENKDLFDKVMAERTGYNSETVELAFDVIRQKLEEGDVKTAIWAMESMGGVVKTNKTDVTTKGEPIKVIEIVERVR